MAVTPEISIVTETFNLTEGQGFEGARRAVAYACRLAELRGNIEVLLADNMETNLLIDLLLQSFPRVRHVRDIGAGYEGIKIKAANEARGRYVVFLDSDCEPIDDNWLEALVTPLREGAASATAGITYYRGNSFMSQILSILDFGFLLANTSDVVGCYASNNCAFTRQILLDIPAPDGPMRSTCYAHAQNLIRAGHPMRRVGNAVARHELPAFFKERWRRGFDLVAACWVDPRLHGTRWLPKGVWAAPLFIGSSLREDWRRLAQGRVLWKWGMTRVWLARAIVSAIRIIDLGGAIKALAHGPDPRWAAYRVVSKP